MGKPSRDKGGRGELEVKKILQARGLDAGRTPWSGAYEMKGDVYGLPGVHLEVKRCEQILMPAWIKQAEGDTPLGSLPVVVYRKSRQPWRVNVDLLALIAKSMGDPIPSKPGPRIEILFSDFLDLLGYPEQTEERLAA